MAKEKCENCGKKIALFGKKIICSNCNNVFCNSCSTKEVYLAESILELKFVKVDLCNGCSKENSTKIDDNNLGLILKAYNIGFNDGFCEGAASESQLNSVMGGMGMWGRGI